MLASSHRAPQVRFDLRHKEARERASRRWLNSSAVARVGNDTNEAFPFTVDACVYIPRTGISMARPSGCFRAWWIVIHEEGKQSVDQPPRHPGSGRQDVDPWTGPFRTVGGGLRSALWFDITRSERSARCGDRCAQRDVTFNERDFPNDCWLHGIESHPMSLTTRIWMRPP